MAKKKAITNLENIVKEAEEGFFNLDSLKDVIKLLKVN